MLPLSVLDLVPVRLGETPADALRKSLELARTAERCGYTRYWVAEHHNMTGVASSATAVVIGHLAGGTKTIRVGSGGIMLPNHSPLVIAEQFGTLESLFPGRIDLGLGRAPGTDQATSRALRALSRALASATVGGRGRVTPGSCARMVPTSSTRPCASTASGSSPRRSRPPRTRCPAST